jgi:hypothetical protein
VADLKTHWKEKGKDELHSLCQNTKRDKGESYFEGYYRYDSSPWFRGIKMNRRAFVSISRMRAGHTRLKASPNCFNIVPMSKCERGDGLQTEEHIFWDCKLYEYQRATMMDILSENSKKRVPKFSYRALTARRKKIFARRLLPHKQHSYINLNNYVRNGKEGNVQNDNSILSDLS